MVKTRNTNTKSTTAHLNAGLARVSQFDSRFGFSFVLELFNLVSGIRGKRRRLMLESRGSLHHFSYVGRTLALVDLR